MIPIAKETTPLFLPCLGVSLNLIPLTLERVNDRAPDVCKGLGGRRSLISQGLGASGGPNVPAYDTADELPD